MWLVAAWGFVEHVFGFRTGDGNSWPYLLWSSSGGYAIAVAIYARKHNCEVRWCWRLGRHNTAAGHTVCRHHPPDGAPSAQDVRDAHHRALRSPNDEGRNHVQPPRR